MLIAMLHYAQPLTSSSKPAFSRKADFSASSGRLNTLRRAWLVPSKEIDVAGEIFTPIKEGDLLHHAEIMTLRQITTNLEGISKELAASRVDLTEMKIDVALIKERQAQTTKLETKISALESKVDLLEARNSKQDGAYTFVALLKDFGPWVFGLLVLAWSVLSGHTPISKP